jgi:Ca2+-binding RTX toxin-like protein
VLVGTMLLVLASVGVGASSAQVAPERPNFVVVMTDDLDERSMRDLDTLAGSGTSNKLVGKSGTDTVRGGPGDDKVVGSGGADSLYGEDGADTVISKDRVKGNDQLDGGTGTDTKVTDTAEKSIVGFP